MRFRVTLITVMLALAFAGCAGKSTFTPPSTGGASTNGATDAARKAAMTATLLKLLPQQFQPRPGSRFYRTDSIGVQDGDRIANFSAAAIVTRTASGLTVVDPSTGQTSHFSANAVVHSEAGGTLLTIPPGGKLPDWAVRAGAVRQAGPE
jgi:hypothetical protein